MKFRTNNEWKKLTGCPALDPFSTLPLRWWCCKLGNSNDDEGRGGGTTGVMTSSGSLVTCDTNAYKICMTEEVVNIKIPLTNTFLFQNDAYIHFLSMLGFKIFQVQMLFINGCQFIIPFSSCNLAYQASLSCAKLKRIIALRWGLEG